MAADALTSQLVETLATIVKDNVTMLLGVEDALQHLEEDVRDLSGVLRDAELRAFTDHAIRGWLADVKDLVYDADDIINYSRTHAEKLARLSSENPVLFCYSLILSFFRRVALHHRTGKRIRSVNERFERIKRRKTDLNLLSAAPRDDQDHRGGSSRIGIQRQTGPLLEPDIVGSRIENDTNCLVCLLTKEEGELGGPRRIRIPIVAITGMGGVGKTTLAQKICNHPSIEDTFKNPKPKWVCVSQQYSGKKLLREIISWVGGGNPGRDESFGDLQSRLATVIKGKKVFLILDDVWAADVWEDLLRNPLQSCATTGSRVLITTRDERVAKKMGAVHLNPVRQLNEEESWTLLRKLVFLDEGIGDGGEVGDIGQQIANKCHGLPLAIKTIAGVLKEKSRTYREWEKVHTDLANSHWSSEELPDKVMGVLYLSYRDLPSHLKQCFIFCSLFPEDYVFQREQLTHLWVAEGFIPEKGGDVLLEDIADNYFNELLSRSLLQPYHPFPNDKKNEKCKMHDLLRSLAQNLAGDEYYVGDMSQLVNATNSSSSSMKLRHLFINYSTSDVVSQVIKEHESLRTLLLEIGRNYTDDTMDFLFSKLGCLRVIHFGSAKIKSLPKSLGNLILLRYLNLSYSSLLELPETIGDLSNLQYLILNRCENLKKLPKGIAKLDKLRYLNLSFSSLEELPETVGNLSNLQHLILNNCENLKKLPRGIAKLYKLRFLDLENCPVDGLPAGIGSLRHLNCLPNFMTNEEDGWCSLEELSSLSQLRTLTINNLERTLIRDQSSSSRGSILARLSHLRHLKLGCDLNYQEHGGDDDQKQKIQRIFEVELFPPPSLKTLEIREYFGLKLPSWYLPNLTRLELDECFYLKQLPALGQLPNLDYLNISRAIRVESIGLEFMGMAVGAVAFPMLTKLDLFDMQELVEWQWKVEDSVVAMPRLEVLNIDYCEKLRSLPGGLCSVTTLTTLSIDAAYSLSVIENLHSLKVLKVDEGENLTRLSNLPALEEMKLGNCHALPQVEGLNSLQSMLIYGTKMESLPGWLLLQEGQPAFPKLKSLQIEDEKNVQLLHRCLVDGADWPKIQHYPQVKITDGFKLFVRYTRDPYSFEDNLDAATAHDEN